MSTIEKKCIEKGVRLTEQRKVIAQVMSESKLTFGSKDHPDVDELHKRVSLVDKKISIATVYRTVKLFEESGIIERHDFKEGKSRYEPSTDEHHDHLIDINSGEIIEFVDKEIEELQNKIAQKLGYKLADHKLELYGTKIKK
ncbi:Fur family transcriptional regulator [Pelagibacteraceae bacterium]|nr:Fur family transcriptional regulator [Pelagibacteraceae bacterium]